MNTGGVVVTRAKKMGHGPVAGPEKKDARRCWGTGAKILDFFFCFLFLFLLLFLFFLNYCPSKRGARRR